jgi:hypothetical protein
MGLLRELYSISPAAFIAVVLVVPIGLLGIVGWAFREGREISFWPPKIGARPLPPTDREQKTAEPTRETNASPLRTNDWYTEWLLGSNVHKETLTLSEMPDRRIVGRRWTESNKGTMRYAVSGYVRDGWYWLEYHDEETLGGGTLLLHRLPEIGGLLQGLVTFPDCTKGHQLCFANQWIPKAKAESYDPSWQVKLGQSY